jgi:hypothetical protein
VLWKRVNFLGFVSAWTLQVKLKTAVKVVEKRIFGSLACWGEGLLLFGVRAFLLPRGRQRAISETACWFGQMHYRLSCTHHDTRHRYTIHEINHEMTQGLGSHGFHPRILSVPNNATGSTWRRLKVLLVLWNANVELAMRGL